MSGGTSTGDDCEAYAHHGYNGIEQATVDRIKAWIAKPSRRCSTGPDSQGTRETPRDR